MIGRGDSIAGRPDRTRIILSGSSSLESPAERALDRVMRSGQPASVLRLHLSRLPPAYLQPYHGRIARCLFDDAVQRCGGQVFACKSGDLVLIAGSDAVASLGAVLLRLFRAEAAGDGQLLGLWSLPADEAAIRAEFAAPRGAPGSPEDPPAPLGAIAAIGTFLAASPPGGGLLRRQTAVRIEGGRMLGLFQELSVSLPAVEARIGISLPHGADPYLFRYIAGQIDAWMLPSLAEADDHRVNALHVNLPLASLTTPGFDALRSSARRTRTQLGVELSLAEAVADLRRFRHARDRLQADGCTVVLDAVGPQAMLHCDLAALRPDLVKFDWSPLVPALPAREQRRLRQALDQIGADRIIVHRAETEAALVWGLGHGVACFQGRHVDLMLAADRVRFCSHSAACSLRQCIDRAAAGDEDGQRGCFDTALLRGDVRRRPIHLPDAVM